MSKKLSGMLVLCVSALWLSGCAYFRSTGPCLGVGCPAHTAGESGQYKPGQAPKPQTATAKRGAAPNAQVAANAQVAVSAPASSNAESAPAPQPAPAAANAAQAKPSTGNRFTEFFAHLIPHHNKTAKPAASAD